tara:strand:- start:18022 stop:19713 length:1692 start_codon:yes stop_codon:yes gene_type:complete
MMSLTRASPAVSRTAVSPRCQTRRSSVVSRPVARRVSSRVTASLAVPGAAKSTVSATHARFDQTTTRRGSSLVPTAVAEAPASATDTTPKSASDFDWHNQWYPVAFLDDLDDTAPLTFTLLGEPLVFWRDPTATELTYRCTADKCPHRLVPLSEGRVNEKGEIECGYHGWSFDGKDGKCTNIPQLPSEGTAMDTALASPRSCVTPYPTQVAQGMLWVLPVNALTGDKKSRPAVPLIPELDNPDCVCQDIFRDLPMDYATLLENVMDVSHVPFTHHNSVGKRENATPVVLEMEGELKPGGFTGIWKEGPRSGKYGSQFTEFSAPSLMRHTLRTEQFTTLTVVYAVPTTPGRCRLMARFPFIFSSALPRMFFKIVPRWWSHLNQNAILEDDQIFLHKQERVIENAKVVKKQSYSQACYMPTKADTYVSAFRRWIADIAGGSPSWPEGMVDQLPPQTVSRNQLLDRFHAHTENCKSCSVAMGNLTKIRKALRVVSLVALVTSAAAFAKSLSPKVTVAFAVVAAVTAMLREFMGGLVQKMKVGPYPPPRRPPSMMESALESARLGGA